MMLLPTWTPVGSRRTDGHVLDTVGKGVGARVTDGGPTMSQAVQWGPATEQRMPRLGGVAHPPKGPDIHPDVWVGRGSALSRRPRRPVGGPDRSPSLTGMDLTLTPAQLELQARARGFVRDDLQPLEVEFERAGGRVSRRRGDRHPRARPSRPGSLGGSLPREVGGQGWTVLEQVLVHEQLGPGDRRAVVVHPGRLQRAHPLPTPSSVGAISTRRCAASAPAATRSPRTGAGLRRPDPRARPRVRDAATGEYLLNGEKWFVTGPPDETDFMIFHCLVVDGDERRPTLFLVDYDTPGVTLKHDPDYMHTFADRHPQFVLDDVRVPASAVLGGVGRADELTNEWFVEERIHIGARCSGAMERLLALAVEWATERVQFGERIYDFQGVVVPAGRLGGRRRPRRGCSPARRPGSPTPGADPKVVHAKASLAKLFASEAAFRCADRVVQVFGGRGYMREYAAERFFRELRVDRIWEGTSEIQRLIIARALEKRGVDRVVG